MSNNLKKVALIDDIVGYGKCSLTIGIPTLSAAGIEVCCGASAIYTAHTPIKGYKKLETDAVLEDTINGWRDLGLKFDALYTGSFSNSDQIYLAMQLIADHPESIKVIDPVLGDSNHFYDKNFKSLLPHMKKLITHADIITPNITEAAFLLDLNPKDAQNENPQTLLKGLQKLGAKKIVLKGNVQGNTVTNYLMDASGNITKHEGAYFDSVIHGAGDFFVHSALAHYLKNENLPSAIDFATKIVSDAVKFTLGQNDFENKGICFEPYLKEITNL